MSDLKRIERAVQLLSAQARPYYGEAVETGRMMNKSISAEERIEELTPDQKKEAAEAAPYLTAKDALRKAHDVLEFAFDHRDNKDLHRAAVGATVRELRNTADQLERLMG